MVNQGALWHDTTQYMWSHLIREGREVASYPDLPAHTQTFMHNYFWKAGRSGWFDDVMVMSPGCCLECERVQAFLTFLGSKRRSKPWKGSDLSFVSFKSQHTYHFFCVDCLQKALGFLGPVETTQTVMKRSLLVLVPAFDPSYSAWDS